MTTRAECWNPIHGAWNKVRYVPQAGSSHVDKPGRRPAQLSEHDNRHASLQAWSRGKYELMNEESLVPRSQLGLLPPLCQWGWSYTPQDQDSYNSVVRITKQSKHNLHSLHGNHQYYLVKWTMLSFDKTKERFPGHDIRPNSILQQKTISWIRHQSNGAKAKSRR